MRRISNEGQDKLKSHMFPETMKSAAGLHVILSQHIVLFIDMAARTSGLTLTRQWELPGKIHIYIVNVMEWPLGAHLVSFSL
jgi:hypothetical protein